MHQTLFSACGGGGYTGFGTLCALYQTIERGTREQSLMERDRHRRNWLATGLLAAVLLVGEGQVPKMAQVGRGLRGQSVCPREEGPCIPQGLQKI